MKRALAILSVAAGLFVSGCGGEGGHSPAAPSSATLAQPSAIDAQAACPSLNGDPGCFSGSIIQGLTATPEAAVSAPISLTGSVNGSTISLHWTKPSSGTPTSYQIIAGSNSGGSNLANLNTGNTNTNFAANGVGAGTYFIRVSGRDASGLGPASNEIRLVVGGGGGCNSAPNAPGNLTVSVNGSSVLLNWNAPSGGCAPTSYVLRAGTSSGSSNVANSNTGNTNTALTANGVGAGTYFIRMHASNANGVSGPSNEVKAVVGGGGGGGGTLAVTRFVCFGDSMTDGGLSALSSGGYPTRLLALLKNQYPSQQFTVINEAKGGERATNGQNRLPGVLSQWNPQVLCLLEGGNDLNRNDIGPPAITNLPLGAISNMVQTARNRGIAVMLASLPPQRPGGSKAGGVPYLSTYNSGIQQIAGSQGATFVNVFAALNSNLGLYIGADGFHPTVAGHNRIADTFFNAIVNRFQAASTSTLTDGEAGWQLDFDGMPSPDQP